MIHRHILIAGLACLLGLFFSPKAYSQISGAGCPNADFGFQNFTNWACFYGLIANPASTPGIAFSRHTIITSAGIDPHSCGGLLTLPPGSSTAARLGNDDYNGEAERMSYSLVVDSSNALFIYKYAVVLEDPSHNVADQPKFTAVLKDSSGNFIDSLCGAYSVSAASGIPGFQTCGTVQWKDWTAVGVNLYPWNGQTVTLEFTTYDCNLGGHFGYAYIAADCRPMQIDITYCPGDNSVILVAPPGFSSYSWNSVPPTLNDTMVLVSPNVNDTHTVSMLAVSNGANCVLELDAFITPTTVYAGFEVNSPCEDLAVFTDTTYVFNGFAQSWIWDFGDNATSTLQNPTHTYSAPGTYNVTLIAYSKPNFEGCVDTVTQQIVVNPKPVAGFTSQMGCIGSPSYFFDTSVPNDTMLSWSWNFGAFATPSTSTSQNPVVSYTWPGNYTVQLTVTNTDGCKDSITLPVTSVSFPSIDYNFTTACAGSPLSFNDMTVTNPQDSIITWIWDMGDGNFYYTPSFTHTYTSGGMYFVEMLVVSANGCTDSIFKPVQVYHNPSVGFTAPNVCLGNMTSFTNQTVILTPSADSTWLWNFGDGNTSTAKHPSHTYLNPGQYIVTLNALSSHNCSGSYIDTIVVYDFPQASFTVNDICVNEPAVIVNNSAPPLNDTIGKYKWDFGDGTPADSSGPNPVHFYASPGTYTITLVAFSGSSNCSDTFTQIINVNQLSQADFTFNDTCHNKTVYLNDASSGQIVSWTWVFGDGSNPAYSQNTTHIFPGPGTYNVELHVSSSVGCSDTIIKQVTIYPLPVPDFTNTTVCEGNATLFTGTSTVPSPSTVTGWNWNFGDGTTGVGANTNHPFANAGNFFVTLINTSSMGCVDSVKKMITVNPNPVPNFGMTTFEGCRPLCTGFFNLSSVGGGGTITSYNWNFGDGGDSQVKNPQYCFSTPGVYDVSLTVETNQGCSATLVMEDTIKVYSYPQADFSANPWETDMSQPVIMFDNLSVGGNTYTWDFGDGLSVSNVNQFNPTHTYVGVGEYVVTLYVEDINGCRDSVQYMVTLTPEFTLYVPSAFSPDGDGLNDYFKAEGIGIGDFEMVIYDRWGQKVFFTDNIAIGWDGSYNSPIAGSTNAPPDVYVYKITARTGFNTGGTHIKEGHFTLAR